MSTPVVLITGALTGIGRAAAVAFRAVGGAISRPRPTRLPIHRPDYRLRVHRERKPSGCGCLFDSSHSVRLF